jgi:hypothetical protein
LRPRKTKEATNGGSCKQRKLLQQMHKKKLYALKYKQHCKIIKEEFETFVARSAHKMQKKKKQHGDDISCCKKPNND